MHQVKLIAIRPLPGCDPSLVKVLKTNQMYRLHQEYHFEYDEQHEVKEINYTPTVPDTLHNVKLEDRYLPVSISGLVGKNGSGKSSLIELLFAAIYNIALGLKIMPKGNGESVLELKEGVNLEIFYSLKGNIFRLRTLTSKNSKDNVLQVDTDINLVRYKSKKDSLSYKITKAVDTNEDFFREYFFYTIAVNYSIYSLNSDQLGKWIRPLFHKNDGYQTPVVINPFRKEGNIDIKVENSLVKQRLLSNLLEPIDKGRRPEDTIRNLAPGKVATTLALTINHAKINPVSETDRPKRITHNGEKCVLDLYHAYTNRELTGLPSAFPPGIIHYLINKLERICRNYRIYTPHLNAKKRQFKDTEQFIRKIIEDNSHITFKVKQALNFLRHNHLENADFTQEFVVDIERLSQNIHTIKTQEEKNGRVLSTMELLPPSFFDIRILMDGHGSFDDLSSGEKQKVHSIGSIVYHLINLNSVFNNNALASASIDYYKYQYINLIFDEVELYFHPDLQRTFIHDLLGFIQKINRNHISYLKGINILFSTHSPYILSDIPNTNILRLDEGNPKPFDENERTFGANIYELLRNDFFMKNGFMGECAKQKIQETILFLNASELASRHQTLKGEYESEVNEMEPSSEKAREELVALFNTLKDGKELIDPQHVGALSNMLKKEKAYYRQIINAVGEPVIRRKLETMYDRFYESDEKEAKKREFERLAMELKATISY